MHTHFSRLFSGISFLLLNAMAAIPGFTQPVAGGGAFTFEPVQCVTEKQSLAIREDLVASIKVLKARGEIGEISMLNVVKFEWPVRLSSQSKDPSLYGISNFVDNDFTYPNKLKDYNCGTRTYDQASGYNHRGIDIFSWPFQQIRQEQGIVQVVAAADGVVIQKIDGNPDKSCAFCPGACFWNAVYVRHADGSVAWYGHLKSGSLTSKQVGNSVVTGEFLGVMGSSGNSTGPHLHFEVWTDDNLTKLVDPFGGPCNALNGNTSWWKNQRPYRRSAINKIMTGSAPPVFPACPGLETPNEKNVFAFGDPLCVTNFYQDQLNGHQAKMELIQPSGVVWNTWFHNSPNNYSSSYWYWNPWFLPNVAGYWKYRLTYVITGQTVTHTFYHGNTPPVVTLKPGNWNDPSVWSDGLVPDDNKALFVCHPVTLSEDKTIQSLVVNEGGQVIVENGKKFQVTNMVLEKMHQRVLD